VIFVAAFAMSAGVIEMRTMINLFSIDSVVEQAATR